VAAPQLSANRINLTHSLKERHATPATVSIPMPSKNVVVRKTLADGSVKVYRYAVAQRDGRTLPAL
jgi:hypothetical protein